MSNLILIALLAMLTLSIAFGDFATIKCYKVEQAVSGQPLQLPTPQWFWPLMVVVLIVVLLAAKSILKSTKQENAPEPEKPAPEMPREAYEPRYEEKPKEAPETKTSKPEPEKPTDYGTNQVEIIAMIDEARVLMAEGQNKEARDIYHKIYKKYMSIDVSPAKKEKIYTAIVDLKKDLESSKKQ